MSVNQEPFSIDASANIGTVALSVSDLDRSLNFYTDGFGFQLLERTVDRAALGAGGKPLLLLTAPTGTKPASPSATGLFHFAVLLPTRADLGRWLQHWLSIGYPMPAQGDHGVSEALYLSDPDGHGIEVYRDRPRDQWPAQNDPANLGTGPVDIAAVLAEATAENQAFNGFPPATTIGHIHLQVGDIPHASAFYHQLLGFDLIVAMPTALFMSAGGYHHHIGANIWQSRGSGPAPADVAQLQYFEIRFGSETARHAVVERVIATNQIVTGDSSAVVIQDPWQTQIHLTIANP